MRLEDSPSTFLAVHKYSPELESWTERRMSSCLEWCSVWLPLDQLYVAGGLASLWHIRVTWPPSDVSTEDFCDKVGGLGASGRKENTCDMDVQLFALISQPDIDLLILMTKWKKCGGRTVGGFITKAHKLTYCRRCTLVSWDSAAVLVFRVQSLWIKVFLIINLLSILEPDVRLPTCQLTPDVTWQLERVDFTVDAPYVDLKIWNQAAVVFF